MLPVIVTKRSPFLTTRSHRPQDVFDEIRDWIWSDGKKQNS
jgi:hypothetical protein